MSDPNGPVSHAEGTLARGDGQVPPRGEVCPPRRKLPVRNPYTGEVDYEITPPTEEELTEP
jgi:hypothetical protein